MTVPSRPFPVIRWHAPDSPEQWNTVIGDALFLPSGRFALLQGLLRLGLKPGDAIAVPAYYCESGLQAIVAQGFEPVFFDIGDDLEIPCTSLEAALSNRKIKAVLLVHFFGFLSVSREPAIRLCRAAEVKIIEDYCHSFLTLPAKMNKEMAGDIFIFSMRKTLPVADGGALVHRDCHWEGRGGCRPFALDFPFLTKRLVEAMVIRLGWPNPYGAAADSLKKVHARLFGKGVRTVKNDGGDGLLPPSWSLGHILSDGSYLRHVAQTRRSNYCKLAEALAPMRLQIAIRALGEDDVPQILPVMDNSGSLLDFLRSKGIGAYRWPGKELPSEVMSRRDIFPNANRINDSIVCLPVHQDIRDSHITFIADAVAIWSKTIRVEQ
ncbi:MAG: DegT/DnrJ/EryC1/StrS family aminotransferase [Pseudomonadota bacterium]